MKAIKKKINKKQHVYVFEGATKKREKRATGGEQVERDNAMQVRPERKYVK